LTQARVVELLRQLNADLGMAMLVITHNIALAAQLCTRIVVMYAGRVVEDGPLDEVLSDARHPYTWHLLRAAPSLDRPRRRRVPTVGGSPPEGDQLPAGCKFYPRCPFVQDLCEREEPPLQPVVPGHLSRCWVGMDTVPASALQRAEGEAAALARPHPGGDVLLRLHELSKVYPVGRHTSVAAVDDVSLEVRQGEILGLVGESGCGKSTLARLSVGLIPPSSGSVAYRGEDLAQVGRGGLARIRSQVQIVFQDPGSSLSPRRRVGQIISEPLANYRRGSGAERRARVEELLGLVGLSAGLADLFPHQLSGGQRQRVGLARALALGPELLVCDEPVSALDVSLQGQIVNLFRDLQEDLGLSLLFISHDLGVVWEVCDRVAVMKDGRIVESGATEEVLRHPRHPYTLSLLEAVPALNGGGRLGAVFPSAPSH
ncbi:MAG: ABC transporter ATP-binding protein, partial [Acidimicrobiales bacterium]